ncbi:39S ribosomal protein L28, mitochondrial-like [Nilaparvata lugens]|uniref:39S ribosomal protein L28, mitochondrial-like n=1 Tax=Nilaparvata lugens TaxID=108931 RepID=UPI000B99D1C2|nr:39S ribosomal protein L28, mitochondrial-like [Nilaparvata lugens]
MSIKNALSKLPPVNRLYKFDKPTILDSDLYKRLPDAYKKFYKEWRMTLPSPVHYVPKQGKWEKNPKTGVITPVQNIPILPVFPRESNQGLWGGEGVVKGYVKPGKYAEKSVKLWFPILKRSVIHSEVLDKRMTTIVTQRTIDLIIDHHGLDHYLLKTRACDIQSELGLKLKRKILMALFYKTLYKDDPIKQEEIYNKYKHYLKDYTEEDIEWYGLNHYEALRKFEYLERCQSVQPPLKHQFRSELIEQMKQEVIQKALDRQSKDVEAKVESKTSWIDKMNPFAKKS